MATLKLLADLRQSPAYAELMQTFGWQTDINKHYQAFIRPISLIPWTIIKIQRCTWPIDFNQLKQTVKTNRGFLLKIEPLVVNQAEIKQQFINQGFKLDPWPLSPSQTLWLNLKPSLNQLIKNLKPKARYNLHLAEKHNLSLKIFQGKQTPLNNLKSFYSIWQARSRTKKLWLPKFNHLTNLCQTFKNDFHLLLAYRQPELLAGLIVLKYGQTSWYWHNSSTLAGRKLFAPTLLTWQAIKLAKNLGCQRFDFEGLYDQRFHRATKSWQGFSRFKLGFGGQIVPLAGTFTKWCNIL